jgi:hypothetical protein
MNADRVLSTGTYAGTRNLLADGTGPRTGTAAPRTIAMTGGRTLVVRPVTPDDADGLFQLYDALDVAERYLRFFCACRPSREFIDGLVNPGPREARVVVELHEAGSTGLVAEAGYSLLGNGNGEFAMAVERDWRGWLGPYLLDLVIDLASANEVPNLEAEVLAMNRTMVAMLRSHGCAVLEHDGWNGYRMMIGTGRKGLSWPADDDRPRVLVETPTARWSLEQAAKAAGMQVITCGGPGQNPSCPVLNGRECGLVACADTIVVRSRPGDRNWEMLTRNHSSSHPDIPVVVETSGRQPPSDALENVRVPAFVHFYLRTSPEAGGTRAELSAD